MIRIRGLRKQFGSSEVLKGIDLDVAKGEVVAIIGPSGTGKTTLLRCINFLDEPTSGSIAIDGLELHAGRHTRAQVYELRKRAAMIFQNFNLFSNKTVLQNLTLAPEVVQKIGHVQAIRRAEDVLAQIGLNDKKNSYPQTLSGGQQQRVAIGRAMALGAKVMLFDEPTSALDPCLVEEVLAVIKRLAMKHSVTMLIVTHEMQFARDVADRVLYMDSGIVVEDAPPQKLFYCPQDARTRQFLQYYRGTESGAAKTVKNAVDGAPITHTERLQNLLSGKTPDRPLFSAWGHAMNFCDRNAKDFARATIDFQNVHDFDFIKVMSNPYYMLEDMGILLNAPQRYDQCVARSGRLLVPSPKDWGTVAFPEVNAGSLGREREAIRRVVEHYQGTVPVLATIFTPAMWIAYSSLRSDDMERAERQSGSYIPLLERYLTDHERHVRPALDRFAELNQRYMEALLADGVSGFFYCTEYARDMWSDQTVFENFEKKYDLRVLNSVQENSFFNILHVCGVGKLRMDWVLEYPVDAFNWDDRQPDNPSLADVRALTEKILVGGLDRFQDLEGADREEIKTRLLESIRRAAAQAGRNLIVSGGCDWSIDATYRFYIWREVMNELRLENRSV